MAKQTDGGFFPAAPWGNFEPDAAINFLQRIRQLLGEKAQLLIGIDQPVRILY